VPDPWTDLLECLDLHPVPSGGTGEGRAGDAVTEFEGRNERLEYHRVFGGQLLGQFTRIASATCPAKESNPSTRCSPARAGPTNPFDTKPPASTKVAPCHRRPQRQHDTTIAAGTIDAGNVAAQRITISGIRADRPLIRFRDTWFCTTDLDPAWEVRETGWHVSVDGDTRLEVTLRMPVPLDRMAAVSPAYTANRAVNAVPYVCAAAPGIQSTLDLPQIVAALG